MEDLIQEMKEALENFNQLQTEEDIKNREDLNMDQLVEDLPRISEAIDLLSQIKIEAERIQELWNKQ